MAKYPPPPFPPRKMDIWSGLGTLGFRLGKVGQNTPPPSYVEGAGVWRLIAVSPKDTIPQMKFGARKYFHKHLSFCLQGGHAWHARCPEIGEGGLCIPFYTTYLSRKFGKRVRPFDIGMCTFLLIQCYLPMPHKST